MADNLPRPLDEFVAWAENHQAIWNSDPAVLGLTSAQALSFKNLVVELQSAVPAAVAARTASKAATVVQNDLLRETRAKASALIDVISGFARDTQNPQVYALAGLNPPSPRTPVPPPNPPESFTASLDSTGNLTLKWRVTQPRGASNTTYRVMRQFNGAGNFEFVDAVGGKEFVDESIPAGTATIAYIVIPRRGQEEGQPSASFTVRFGHAPGGALFIAQAA